MDSMRLSNYSKIFLFIKLYTRCVVRIVGIFKSSPKCGTCFRVKNILHIYLLYRRLDKLFLQYQILFSLKLSFILWPFSFYLYKQITEKPKIRIRLNERIEGTCNDNYPPPQLCPLISVWYSKTHRSSVVSGSCTSCLLRIKRYDGASFLPHVNAKLQRCDQFESPQHIKRLGIICWPSQNKEM